jgi:hypothetical protein
LLAIYRFVHLSRGKYTLIFRTPEVDVWENRHQANIFSASFPFHPLTAVLDVSLQAAVRTVQAPLRIVSELFANQGVATDPVHALKALDLC